MTSPQIIADTVEIKSIIKKYGINQGVISERIGMIPNTFRVKICPGVEHLNFSKEEIKKIRIVLGEIARDLAAVSE